jgi:hypothetical protein
MNHLAPAILEALIGKLFFVFISISPQEYQATKGIITIL